MFKDTEMNNNPTETAYDNSESNDINSRSQELEFHLDHDLVQSPSSEYVTVNQFKTIVSNLPEDTFS